MKTQITGAKVLVENNTWQQESLVIDGPFIAGTGKTGHQILDASNCLVLPGIIDIHGDAFERLIMPRPSTMVPFETGFCEADRQITASGITTAYFSMTYTWETHDAIRCESGAKKVMTAYHSIKEQLDCDPKLHLRFEIYHLDGINMVQDWLNRGMIDLLAFNDHFYYFEEKSRSQKSLADLATRFRLSLEQTKTMVETLRQLRPSAHDAVQTLAKTAREQHIVMASHDETKPEVRQWYHDLGCTLSEFPCNEATAKEAIRLGDPVLLGAPNAMRGKTHYRGMSARTCVENRLCTVLTSDYYYPSPLHAVFLMADLGLDSVEELWPLVSGNAAKAVGLNDRGEIKEGLRADLVLVEKLPDMPPRVYATFVGGQLVYASRSYFINNRLSA